jgi:hypothetical protein
MRRKWAIILEYMLVVTIKSCTYSHLLHPHSEDNPCHGDNSDKTSCINYRSIIIDFIKSIIKCRQISTRLHGVTCQEIVLFTPVSVRSSEAQDEKPLPRPQDGGVAELDPAAAPTWR